MPNYFDQLKIANPKEIDTGLILDKPAVSTGVTLLSEAPLHAIFVAQDWHFGIVIPLKKRPAMGNEEILVVRSRITVPAGSVRFGCVNAAMDAYVANELEVFPSFEMQQVEVEIPNEAAFLVLRTGVVRDAISPEVEVHELRVLRGARVEHRSVTDVAAGKVQKAFLKDSGVARSLDSLDIELLITHSTRVFDSARASAAFIRKRYGNPRRFEGAPLFETLASSSTQHYLHGAVTHFRFAISKGEATLRSLRCIDSLELIQHASIAHGRFVICCNGFLCVLPSLDYPLSGKEFDESSPLRIDDPWFSGLHSVVETNVPDECVVSASGPDAILWVDLRAKKVTRRFRLPESIYGHNYPLSKSTSVHDHYIPNDYQLGHLNSAYPDDDGGCYLSTLGQGDIAHVDRAGNYTLLASGYIGVHGVRRSMDGSFIYFTESPAGRVNRISANGTVETLVQLKTSWLHDAQQIAPDVFACLPVDRNELLLVDAPQGREIARFDMSARGLNPQFISVVRVNSSPLCTQ